VPDTSAPMLALFDLDGTITRHGTLAPYALGLLLRHPARILRLPLTLPALVRFALGRCDHGALKAAFLRRTFGGLERCELDAWTARFVPRLIEKGLFADACAAIERHRLRGDRLALLSASTDLYVPAIGTALGFDDVECTGVAWAGSRLLGTLTTANRRGAEKVRCLEALRTRHPGLATVAYGNAPSDLPHLRLAERGVLVNGSRSAMEQATRDSVTCVTWR
jgi:HAD superfamily hydrolase (TIGR01490 family)